MKGRREKKRREGYIRGMGKEEGRKEEERGQYEGRGRWKNTRGGDLQRKEGKLG